MRDNPWRGKYGVFAAGATLLTAAAIALMSTPTVVQAQPAISEPLPLVAEQKRMIERIIKNTEKRLADFRYTHVKLEMLATENVAGEPIKYPSPSRLEAWNDSRTHVFRAQFRPQVSRWINGAKPFITENKNDIGNAKSNLFYSVDFLATDNESNPQPPEAMYPDYLGIREATDLIGTLRSVLLMSMFSHGNQSEHTISEIEFQGKPAVQIQEIFSADGKFEQKRTFVVVPGENDMLRFRETASRSDRGSSISQWVVNKVGRTSDGQYYPAAFTVSLTGGEIGISTDFAVSSFEVLPGLPDGITENPRADFKGTK
jgi:hypothetical protein